MSQTSGFDDEKRGGKGKTKSLESVTPMSNSGRKRVGYGGGGIFWVCFRWLRQTAQELMQNHISARPQPELFPETLHWPHRWDGDMPKSFFPWASPRTIANERWIHGAPPHAPTSATPGCPLGSVAVDSKRRTLSPDGTMGFKKVSPMGQRKKRGPGAATATAATTCTAPPPVFRRNMGVPPEETAGSGGGEARGMGMVPHQPIKGCDLGARPDAGDAGSLLSTTASKRLPPPRPEADISPILGCTPTTSDVDGR